MKNLALAILVLMVFFVGFIIYAAIDMAHETFNANPCQGKYNADEVLETLKFEGLEFNCGGNATPQGFCWKCENFDASVVNCKVLSIRLGCFKDTLKVYEEAFALRFAKIFWSNPVNLQNVDSIYLSFNDAEGAFNSGYSAKFRLSKDDILKIPEDEPLPEVKHFQYKVLNKSESKWNTTLFGFGGEITYQIDVEVSEDFKNISDLAQQIYQQSQHWAKEKEYFNFTVAVHVKNSATSIREYKKYFYHFWSENKES